MQLYCSLVALHKHHMHAKLLGSKPCLLLVLLVVVLLLLLLLLPLLLPQAAGGTSSDGHSSILDIVIDDTTARTVIALGSHSAVTPCLEALRGA
jgi:hypothetical protein